MADAAPAIKPSNPQASRLHADTTDIAIRYWSRSMDLSIAPTTAATVPVQASDSNLNSVALTQRSATADAAASAVTSITAVDPQVTSARVAKYLDAMSINFRTGKDAEGVANALVSSMQALILQRPDIANAQFDFQSDDGSIKVTSDSLSDSDKSWLQNLLNSNSALVQAVNTFHSDAVGGYAAWAAADGTPLTDAQSQAVSKKADGMVSFMQLFHQLGTAGAKGMFNDGAYYAPNGAKIDLTQNTGNAVGFLSFMQSARAMSNGTDEYVGPAGHTLYGAAKFDVFNASMMPDFYPSLVTSLGVHEVA
ncbi:hypothetical protein GXB81_08365 [Paraburkholderia sp. Ac-20336]|uniref:hypothetical protein n=1 Tax=Paraburkholderia sp. Ac-20336 TaxID=2703886 RepID=UPI00197DCE3E|nr:hypothetical protein [Paraburkholderia sp. Ac-20336]MBN3803066.1 hypothetical protein [Paraburkholderia sp. Ac-20336]